MRKAVVILGRREEADEVDFIQSQGYAVILLNSFISFADALKADIPLEMELNDEEAVIAKIVELSHKLTIAAVYTNNDYRVMLGARIAEKLGIQTHLSTEAAKNCSSKKTMRERLAEHHISPVEFTSVKTPREVLNAVGQMSFPIVVKPSNDAGSNLVQKCHSIEEVWEAVIAVKNSTVNWVGQPLEEDVLLEEFLEGQEYSVESCTIHGRTSILAITEKKTSAMVEEMHQVPAALATHDLDQITELIIQSHRALGIDYVITHTEFKITSSGPKIIEINPRLAGDHIPDLVHAATGYDLRRVHLHLLTGGNYSDIPRDEPLTSSAVIRFIIAEQDGVVRIKLFEGGLPGIVKQELNCSDGGLVRRTTTNYNRLGYLIAYDTEDRSAVQHLESAFQTLQFAVDSGMKV